MKTSLLRSVSLLVLASIAVSAQAYVIRVEGTINDSNIVTSTTLFYSDLPELNNTVNYSFNVAAGGTLNANFVNGSSQLQVTSLPGSSLTFVGGVYSYSGSFQATTITNLSVLPTGTYFGEFDTVQDTFFLQLDGVSTVPGPSALAPFAMAAFSTFRRRRKQG